MAAVTQCVIWIEVRRHKHLGEVTERKRYSNRVSNVKEKVVPPEPIVS